MLAVAAEGPGADDESGGGGGHVGCAEGVDDAGDDTAGDEGAEEFVESHRVSMARHC